MAISISFTGWANELLTFEWGSVLKVSHKNRRKNDAGEWETVSTDYIDVVIDKNNRDQFTEVLDAQYPARVTVQGNAKFGTYEGKNGTGISIKVYPSEVTFQSSDQYASAGADAPF